MANINLNKLIAIHLKEVRRFPVLSPEESTALLKEYYNSGEKVKDRDVSLRNKIVNHNLRLVLKSAIGIKGWNEKASDLIQEGYIGLIRSVEKYNPNLNVPFASYAWYWIRAKQFSFLIKDSNLIKIGSKDSHKKIFFGLEKYKREMAKLGIEPTSEDIANHLKIKEKDLKEIIHIVKGEVSLDMPIRAEDQGLTLGETLPDSFESRPDKIIQDYEDQDKIRDLMREFRTTLSYRGRIIFERRFIKFKPDTFANIAKDLYMSRQRAKQVEIEIVEKWNKFLSRKNVAAA